MKRFKSIFYIVALAFLMFFSNITVSAQNTYNGIGDEWEQVEFGLLTCAPQQLMYGQFGHTAIRMHNPAAGIDVAFNYGTFSFDNNWFALKFLFGFTNYELGIVPMPIFCQAYEQMGSQVTEQVLNLNSDEKRHLADALSNDYKEENRVYLYNFFYNNCTTKARDVILSVIDGSIVYNIDEGMKPTWREMLHTYTDAHPWAQLGEDLCLGIKADAKTNYKEQEFLPDNLMRDFASAQINAYGDRRPLVLKTRTIVPPGVQVVESEFLLPPWLCAVLVLILIGYLTGLEWRKKKCFWILDAIIMTAVGVAGIIILCLFFSKHPTTSTNIMILLFNPIPLVLMPRMVWRSIKQRRDNIWMWMCVPLVIFGALGIMGVQTIPMSVYIIWLAITIRVVARFIHNFKLPKPIKAEVAEVSNNIINNNNLDEPRITDNADSSTDGSASTGGQ